MSRARIAPVNIQLNELAPAVIHGRAEVSLLDVPDAVIALEKWPGQIKVIGPMTGLQQMGCGFRPSDADLADRFNRYLAAMRSVGRYRELVNRYYPGIEMYFPDLFAAPEPPSARHD